MARKIKSPTRTFDPAARTRMIMDSKLVTLVKANYPAVRTMVELLFPIPWQFMMADFGLSKRGLVESTKAESGS